MSSYLDRIEQHMHIKSNIRNISIVSHVDHGKTTLADHLLEAGGLIAKNMAGNARVLDYLEEEQLRGITIKTANISFIAQCENQDYLINLVDTPGHVDFSGMVSQALRLIDGVIIVVDVVEQIMAQTESVLKQAIKEHLRPILFLNKVDRLINELKLTEKEIKNRLDTIVQLFNNLIFQYGSEEIGNKWKVSFSSGTLILGSALYGWGISRYSANIPKFEKIIQYHNNNKINKLKEENPLINSLIPAIVYNIPNPVEAQKRRIIFITEFADERALDAIKKCEDKGPGVMCVGKLLFNKNAGIIAIVRLFSGKISQGDKIVNRRTNKISQVQRVYLCKGESFFSMPEITAGNIAAIVGLSDVRIGDTLVTDVEEKPNILFKQITYLQEPVMAVRIEPERISDIPKLREILEIFSKIKPNFNFEIDENTGEIRIFGIGELQLEIILKEIKETGIKLYASKPEVALVEQISKEVNLEIEDSLNILKFDIKCFPTIEIKKEYTYTDQRNNCLIIENKLLENKPLVEYIITGFQNAIKKGPIKGYPIRNLSVKINDIIENDTNALRYEIVVPGIKYAIFKALTESEIAVYEPVYSFYVSTPLQYLGHVLNVLHKYQASIKEVMHEKIRTIILGEIRVETALSITPELRSASEGFAFWEFKLKGYKKCT